MFVNTIFETEAFNQQKVAELTAEVKEGALVEKVIRQHLSSYAKDLFVPEKICCFRRMLQRVTERLTFTNKQKRPDESTMENSKVTTRDWPFGQV